MSEIEKYSYYDEYADKFGAAYTAFERTYKQLNPPPDRKTVKSENRWIIVALMCLVAASVIVSGSRTIVEFGGGVIGGSAFVMLELGMTVMAFIRTRFGSGHRTETVKLLINRGMWLAFAVAVAANLHATLKPNGFDHPFVNVVILVFVAISAPVLAFISGDVAGMLVAVDAQRENRIDDEYQVELRQWKDALNTAWNTQKARWNIKIETPETPVQSRPPLSNGQSIGQTMDMSSPSVSTLGHTKKSNASEIVETHLRDHPEDINENARLLGERLGVGKSTVNNVQQRLKIETLSNQDTQPALVQ